MKKRPRIQIHRTDAFEWLEARKARSIHAIVTDPPYGVVEYLPEQLKKRKEDRGIWRIPRTYDGHVRASTPRFTVLDARDLKALSQFYAKLAKAALPALVPGGHVILASQVLLSHYVMEAFVDAGFELRGQLARLVRTLRGGDRPKGAHEEFREVSVMPRSCWEPWLLFRKPCDGTVSDNLRRWGTGALGRPSEDLPFVDVLRAPPARGQEKRIAPHPSLKPQALMRQLVAAALPFGKGVILDPFMGSGSTVAAAQAVGVTCVGLELNSEYFRMAKVAIPKLAALELAHPGQSKALAAPGAKRAGQARLRTAPGGVVLEFPRKRVASGSR